MLAVPLCLRWLINVLPSYGSASMLTKNLNVPPVWTPSTYCTLTLAPGASATGSATESDELTPPPNCCCTPGAEASSSVVPWTVTVQGAVGGVAGGVCTAVHVALSMMLLMTTSLDVIARRSAKPGVFAEGKVLTSMMRKRRRVTGEPVLLTKRRRMASVPFGDVLGGPAVKSRKRFGAEELPVVASKRNAPSLLLRSTGLERFSGPGAPILWPAPIGEPCVSTKTKSDALLFVSFGRPPCGHAPVCVTEPPLPHWSRLKL